MKRIEKAIAVVVTLSAILCLISVLTMRSEGKVPPVVTLIQNEPAYYENTEIVGSENACNIEKFSNPEPPVAETPLVDAQQHTSNIHLCSSATERLTKSRGVFNGPSGKETWYSLDMTGVIRIMRGMGYDEEQYPYTVDDDGIKRFGGFVMIAANLELRPRGTIIMTSWGEGIVCDTGAFCQKDKTAIDIATNWSGR